MTFVTDSTREPLQGGVYLINILDRETKVIEKKVMKNNNMLFKLMFSILMISQVLADPFEFNQSVVQAAYFYTNVTIDENQINYAGVIFSLGQHC